MEVPVATLPLVQRLKSAVGDATKIQELVHEAERQHHDDLHSLCEVYGVAVDVYGHAQSAQDWIFRELCVKRMRTLCRLNPAEAREFHNRLRVTSVGRADARMYEARAEMEERLGNSAKAVKMLQEGVKENAQPMQLLQRKLLRLQAYAPAPDPGRSFIGSPKDSDRVQESGISEAPLTPCPASAGVVSLTAAAPAAAPAATPAAAPAATPAVSLAAAPAAAPAVAPAVAPSEVPAAASAAAPRSKVAAGPPSGHGHMHASNPPASGISTVASSLAATPQARPLHTRGPPRILGLGSPMRKLPTDDDGGDDAQEEEASDPVDDAAHTKAASHIDDAENYTTTMSMMPLSPIKEVDSPKASSVGSVLTQRRSEQSSTPRAIPPPGSTAPCYAPPSSPHPVLETPLKENSHHEASMESSVPLVEPLSDAGRGSSKVIYVNGKPYTQVRTIGRGGSSKVYMVHNPEGDFFALKRIATSCPKQLEAFQNEVTLLQQLRDHEHVIQVIDAEVDRDRGRIHIVMEPGDMDLGRYLQTEPRLSLSQIQQLWRQMLEAVQVIHNERIVHSDLKPGNFLLVKGCLKVIDFGIAKRISGDTTHISRDTSVGTLSYMAPEAVKQGQLKLGRASDIWSLGIILYQMVYEHPPFAHMEPMQRLLTLSDPNLTIKLPTTNRLKAHGHSSVTQARLTEVLGWCLQRDPQRRPTIPELLAHPLLRTSLKVTREALRSVVAELLVGLLPEGVHFPENALTGLGDEVWERLERTAVGALPAQDGEGAAPPVSSGGFEALRRFRAGRTARPLTGASAANVAAGGSKRLGAEGKENAPGGQTRVGVSQSARPTQAQREAKPGLRSAFRGHGM